MKNFFYFFIAIIIINIQGCSYTTNKIGICSTAGITIYPEKLQQIKKGMYQTEVFNILGSPTFTNIFNQNIWYYISQKTWYVSVLSEKLIDQQILILTFDDNGILLSINNKTIKDAKNIKYDSMTTNFYYKKTYLKPDLYK